MAIPPEQAAAVPAAAPGPLRRWGGLAAGLLVVGFLAYALVDGWSSVSAYHWDVEPWMLAVGSLVLLVFYATCALGYGAIVDRLHHPEPPPLAMISIWARSLLGRYVPGNVLMVLGRVVLSHDRGVPRRVTLAATAYEQILTVALAAAGAVLFVALYGGDVGGWTLWLVVLLPLGLVLLHPRVFGPLSSWGLRRIGREPLPRLLAARPLAGLALWYAASAAVLAVGMWLVVRGIGGPGVGGPAFVGLAFLTSFALSMVAFIFPSGLGVREGAFALALASQDIPGGVAVALSVGARLVLTLVELVFIGIVVLAGRRR
ncbi:MAG: lysylphosphatidylglycerol synthase domain-containing protein [Thermoleophilia bacterium]